MVATIQRSIRFNIFSLEITHVTRLQKDPLLRLRLRVEHFRQIKHQELAVQTRPTPELLEQVVAEPIPS